MTSADKPIRTRRNINDRPPRAGLEKAITADDAPPDADPLGFDAPARPIGRNTVQQVLEVASLQWANGKTLARADGAQRFTSYVGFHVEVGKDTALDDALVEVATLQIEIKHQRPGGAEVVRHWDLGPCVRFYPVSSGPVAPSISGLLRRAAETAEAGIGVRWASGERSKLAVRGFVALPTGNAWTSVPILVQLSVRSRMSDVLLAALIDHVRVCEAADALIDRARHPDVVTLHELALPLEAGSEEEWGKGDTATVTPFCSAHPAEANRDYIKSIWRPKALHEAACAAWGGIQAWASEYAASGNGEGEVEGAADLS